MLPTLTATIVGVTIQLKPVQLTVIWVSEVNVAESRSGIWASQLVGVLRGEPIPGILTVASLGAKPPLGVNALEAVLNAHSPVWSSLSKLNAAMLAWIR